MKRSRLAALAVVGVTVALIQPLGQGQPVIATPADRLLSTEPPDGELIEPTDDRLVIAIDDDQHLEAVLAELEAAAGATASVVSAVSGGVVVQFDQPIDQTSFDDAIAEVESLPGVEFAEPDERRFITSSPNDPLYSSQWSLTSLYGPTPAAGIDIEGAWTVTTGSPEVVVAVIDTGILPHPDIASRLTAGADLITSPSVSADGDGRDGDNTDAGDTCGSTPSSWHGLHVAGTIGATANNGLGVAGLDQRARIQPVRVLGTCGGWLSDIADAIRWAAGLPVPGVALNPTPARILNLSLGGASPCSSIEQSAIDAVVAIGAIVIVAAGNSAADLDTSSFSPASCDNVITVAATSRFGDRANYSNYGSIVDIAAPGGLQLTASDERILSLSNVGVTSADLTPSGWTYSYKQGTSMAAPHVSGVVSLMLAANGRLTNAQVEQILEQTARSFPVSSRGAQFTCSSDPVAQFHCGAGLLDAGAAVRAADALVTTPSTPQGVNAAAQAGSATVAWSPPASDGGSNVTGYVATANPGGQSCAWSAGPLTCSITGLDIGRQYTVSVVAQNRKGDGPSATTPPFTWWPTFSAVGVSRVFDTRLGSDVVRVGRVVPGASLSVPVLGFGGVPVSGVGAVSLNVTVTDAVASGFLTVFGCGGSVPWVSSLNFGVGESVANAVIVPPGVDGRVCFDVSSAAHVIADVNGWFAAGSGFSAVGVSRVFDTRLGSDVVRVGRVVPGASLSVPVLGFGGVPVSGVGAVSLNVTVTDAVASGFLTVFGCGGSVPWVSSLNFGVGESVANAVIVPPGVDGRVCFDVSSAAHVIADVNGWFAAGSGFSAVGVSRVFDTRLGSDVVRVGRVVPGASLSVPVLGFGGVPVSGVGAVSLNVTVTDAVASGFLTVFGCGGSVPWVSSLNFGVGESVANAVIVPPGVDGRVCFDVSSAAHVIADVNGWFAAG